MSKWVLLAGAVLLLGIAVGVEGMLARALLAAAAAASLALCWSESHHAQDVRLGHYRRLLSADARCILWSARIRATTSDWRTYSGEGTVPLEWDMKPLDREAAEVVLGHGYRDDQFTELWSKAFHPQDEQPCERRVIAALIAGSDHLTQTYRLRTAEGHWRWYLEEVRINEVGEGHWNCAGVCIDITDRHEAEEALQFGNERMHHLMLQARCVLYEVEAHLPESNVPNAGYGDFVWKYGLLDWDAAQSLLPLDIPDGEYFLFHISSRRHPEDAERMDRNFQAAYLERRPSYSQEFRAMDKDGHYQWLSETVYIRYITPTRCRLVGILQDVTDRKRIEENLQDVMRQAECILFHGSVVVPQDPADTDQYRWNMKVADVQAAQRVLPLDLQPGEDYVEAWMRARFPDDCVNSRRILQAAMQARTLSYSHSFRCHSRDGSLHWMTEDVRFEPIGPRTFRMVTVCIDNTAQKQSELALERARNAAEEANAAKSAFLANMSHEIRTPMTSILGYTELLSDVNVAPEDRESYARTIRRNGEHLLTIVDEILDLSRIEQGKVMIHPTPCSPVQVAEEVISLLRPKASEKLLDISLQVNAGISHLIVTDPVRLRQILMNLVGNAIKFTERGFVRIVLAPSADEAGLEMLRVEVIDTGVGIAPAQLPLLFQPFERGDVSTRRRFGGSGLGLAISRRLAHLLGGDISVLSEPGKGSTFIATIKAPRATEEGASAVESRFGPIRLDAVRVLLAEDGADNRRLICIHLRRLGASVIAVENGKEACELALRMEQSGEPFNVILMDMQMPVMDGYSAASLLRRSGYQRPIVALTAHAMEGDRERCVCAGCDEYVVKPIDIARLSTVLSEQSVRQHVA